MTVKEFAAGSAKALLTTTKVLFRILVGLLAALWSMVLFIWANAPRDQSYGYGSERGADGLTIAERNVLVERDGMNSL
ncbi:MAG: hypothetical protein AAGA91_19655 [Pseudomonadota bacterium]